MPRLELAQASDIDVIYRESHALWGAGLSLEDYRAFWDDLARTGWARRHLSYRVWVDDRRRLLSSLKLYRPRVRLFGRAGRVAGIGAVFTPRAYRRRGHASALIEAVVDEARARGDLAALLFTDIGTSFYRALGFTELAAEEAWGRLPGAASPPEGVWSLRPMGPSDLETVCRAQARAARARSFAVLRDREYWRYLVERSRSFFARLDGSDLTRRFQLATLNGAFAGYLVTVDSGDIWIIREAEAADDEPSTLAAILRTGAYQARARGMRRVYGWLGREVEHLVPDWRLRFQSRRRAIPMLVALNRSTDLHALKSAERGFIPYLDQF